jgi:hypothetical protein
MKKTFAVLGALAIVALLGASCGGGGPTAGGPAGGGGGANLVITDMCKEIPAEWVSQAIGKAIVKSEAGPGQADYCQYYTEWSEDYYKIPGGTNMPGGPFVALNYENLSVENQKQGNEYLGRKIETNDKIKMEHFLSVQEDGLINSIYLVIDPSHFVSVDRSSGKVLSEEETVDFAVKVAEKLKSL